MEYKSIDFNHPGIQLIENMRKQGMIDNKIHVNLSEQQSGIQRRCMQAIQSGMIPNKDDAKLLHKLEVALTYVGAYDIDNPVAKSKIINALNGKSATGNSLMSTMISRQIESRQTNEIKNDYNTISFKM